MDCLTTEHSQNDRRIVLRSPALGVKPAPGASEKKQDAGEANKRGRLIYLKQRPKWSNSRPSAQPRSHYSKISAYPPDNLSPPN